MQEQSELLTIHFSVDNNTVDAEAVAAMIKAFSHLIDAANREVNPDSGVSVKVNAFNPGSLEIPLVIYGILPISLFLFEKAPNIVAVIDLCRDYFSVKKWLKGKPLPEPLPESLPAKQEDGKNTNAPIFNIENLTINYGTLSNVYNNNDLNKDVEVAFHETKKDTSVKAIALSQGKEKKEIVRIPAENFSDFETAPSTDDDQIAPTKKERTERAIVSIHTPVLVGKGKWKVIFKEQAIRVSIKDKELLRRVESTHYRFGNGDRLDVDINIISSYDPRVEDFIIDPNGYAITKFRNYIPAKPSNHSPPENKKTVNKDQQKFPFEDK